MGKKDDEGSTTRIAIVDAEKCKPKKCKQECKRMCPVVRMGKICIEVEKDSKLAEISEELCIGCGICVKKCPFEAINIINLPKNLEGQTTHRYGPNSFKLHRLPTPRPGQVLGLVGINGIGKSTALKILAGKLKPNLGRFADPPDWQEILIHFRGSELQNFFTKLLEDDIKAIIKPQYVDHIPRAVKGTVDEVLSKKDELKNVKEICVDLDLTHVKDRTIDKLSGGELQRFAIAVCCVQNADIYMFDEPSSYLDVRQRLKAAVAIRAMCAHNKFVISVEHDLSVLDYLSDFVCCLYGKPGAYGVVTMPFSVREGINIFLAGFVPTENMRFRDFELSFKAGDVTEFQLSEEQHNYTYPAMSLKLGDFKLTVEPGSFTNSQIVVMLGQNGTGKTTFIRMLAGLQEPDGGVALPKLNVSYKPQKIAPKFPGTVRQLLHTKIRSTYTHPQFMADVMKPMRIEELMDQEVKNLSGGELQRVAITLALGRPADIYLIDEPSAYLDSEQRVVAGKVIKRFILHAKKTAFVVEHDFIMATYLADNVIVYSGQPGIDTTAHAPQALLSGMNRFLKDLEITFRRDPTNYRPRINKMDSIKDQEQKAAGNYFFLDTGDNDDDERETAKRRAKKTGKPDEVKAEVPPAGPAGAAPVEGGEAAPQAPKAKPKSEKEILEMAKKREQKEQKEMTKSEKAAAKADGKSAKDDKKSAAKPKAKPEPSKPPPKERPLREDMDEDEDEDEEEGKGAKKQAPPKKAPAKKESDDDDDEEEEDSKPAQKKKAAPKKK